MKSVFTKFESDVNQARKAFRSQRRAINLERDRARREMKLRDAAPVRRQDEVEEPGR